MKKKFSNLIFLLKFLKNNAHKVEKSITYALKHELLILN